MQRIPLSKAAPGMVLAQPVCRQEGLVLAGEGLVLSEAAIGRIRQAGVGSVWVEGNPLGGEGDVGSLRKVADNLPFLFRRLQGNVFMMTLCAVLGRHFARRMAEMRVREDAAIEAGKGGETAGPGRDA